MNNISNLKENTAHGNFILPFSKYNCHFSNDFKTVPIHWHEEIEITFINKGCGTYKIDLIPYSLNEGDIVIVKPLSLHSIHKKDNEHMIWKSIVFNLNMLNSALTDGCLIKYFAPILNKQNTLPTILNKNSKGYIEISQTLVKIYECYDKKEYGFELELKSYLYYFFFLIYKNDLFLQKKESNLSNDTINKIKTILNYIKNNLTTNLLIKDIASICNFSEYHFMRFFKKYIGMTCIEYINNCRLELASELLSSTDKAILDISFEVGYNNVSYFNKVFKNKYNLTPKQFRIQKRNVT